MKRRAFTLIELMVVVAIIGILAAVVLPRVLSVARKDNGAAPQAPKAEPAEQAPIRAASTVEGPDGEPAEAAAPEVLAADFDAALKVFYVLADGAVDTRYTARLAGDVLIKPRVDDASILDLSIPFPQGISDARGVRLQIKVLDKGPFELDAIKKGGDGFFDDKASAEAQYSVKGIRWKGAVPAGGAVALRLRYETDGGEAFRARLIDSGRCRRFKLRLLVENASDLSFPSPDKALRRTRVEEVKGSDGQVGTRVIWECQDLVTELPIVVELPSSLSPLGRILLLLKLAGLAIFLFGAGFHYLSEGYRPGQLDDFTWSHFLLVAVTYFLFFPVFAVCEERTGAYAAAGLGAAASLPLLVFHLARFTDLRFALTRGLPLALVTLACVLSGVYLTEHRVYVFTGAGVLVVAYLTLDLRSWLEKVRAHQELKSRRDRIEYHTDRIEDARADLEKSLALARESIREFQTGEATAEPSLSQLRARIGGRPLDGRGVELQERLTGLASRGERWAARGEDEALADFEAHDTEAAAIIKGLGRLEEQVAALTAEGESLRAELDAKEANDTLRFSQRVGQLSRKVEAAGDAEADRLAERAELLRSLESRGDKEALGRLAQGEAEDLALEKILGECRSELGGIRGLAPGLEFDRRSKVLERRLDSLAERDQARGEDLRRLARELSSAESALHCPACGQRSGKGQRYCAACSVPLPAVFACRSCQREQAVPLHLLRKRDRDLQGLRCIGCGQQLAPTGELE